MIVVIVRRDVLNDIECFFRGSSFLLKFDEEDFCLLINWFCLLVCDM